VRVEPIPEMTDIVCSPYHIERISKPEPMSGEWVRFVLVDRIKEVIKQEYLIMLVP